MKGFEGKLLIVNLTDKEISEEEIDDTIATNFIGGAGYACKYLYDKIDKDTDPLSPDNILMFMTGLFCGSNAPTSGRFVVCAKSPLTGIWGESNCGGFFGPELRKAGYDGIVFKGSSESPVLLEINENKAEIKDASDLWGKGIFETSKILKEKSGSQLTRVACIGQAGENLVKYAIIASEDKAAGRTGMGAVMGSKKLKAITVRGTKRKYNAFEPEEFREAVKVTNEAINSAFATQMFGDLGTSSGVDMYNASGELPIKYWKQGTWEGAFNISGSTAFETMFTGSYPCFSCPIGCSKRVKIDEGEYKTDGEIEAAEYETVAGFGSMLLNDDLGAIQRANYLCNDYGIDTISGSSTISFIYDLFDTGRISTEDLNGLEPKWGEITPALELLKKIALREGIGDVMAEGSDYVGKKFKIPQDDIATVYGMEIPYHDLRRMYGMAVSYALATPRGPCHTSCDAYMVILGLPFSQFGIELNVDWYQDDKPMAEFCARIQDYRALYASLILCSFANPPSEMVLEMVIKATGLNLTMEDFKLLGERIYMIKRMFNLKMGLTPADDRLPKIALNPVNEGGSAGKTPNFQQLKNAYYEYRQFDKKSGYPSQDKLKELGLNDL
ncbi:MAG TPA: aldehyde ferredoxin oxidoreductase family protein [Candidatus Nanopelagicaceae bacterium]|nr:aldehyde ferredoxin oxidoreductase family protein [Candidatus Nanopelagicaceae bacterium]